MLSLLVSFCLAFSASGALPKAETGPRASALPPAATRFIESLAIPRSALPIPSLPPGIPQKNLNVAGPAPVANGVKPAITQIRDMTNGQSAQNGSSTIERRSADAMDGRLQRDERRDEFPAWVKRETGHSLDELKSLGAQDQLKGLRQRFSRERPMSQASIDIVNAILKERPINLDKDLASRKLSNEERIEIKRMLSETLTVFKRLKGKPRNDVEQNIFDHIVKGQVKRKTLYRVMDPGELELWHRNQKLPLGSLYVDTADTLDHLGQYAYPGKVLVAMTSLCVEHVAGAKEREHLAFFIEDVSLIGGYGPEASADFRPIFGDAVPIIVAPNRSEQ